MKHFRKFLSYYRIYRKRFSVVMICALLSSLTALMIPLSVRRIAQVSVQGKAGGEMILSLGLTMAIWIVLHLIFNYIFDYYGHALGARMEGDLRNELFAHLEKLSFSFFDHHKTAHLMSHLTNDLLDLSELFHHGPEDYVINLVRLIGASVILIGIHPTMALAVLVVIPVMIGATILWGKILRKVSRTRQEKIAGINAEAQDSLSGIRTVQTFTLEEVRKKHFALSGRSFVKSRRDVYRTEAYADKTILGLTYLCTVAVAVLGGLGVMREVIDLADLITFILYVSYLTEPVQHLSWMITQFQSGLAGFDRVMDLMETEPEIRDKKEAEDVTEVRGEIALQDVTFGYTEEEKVLDSLDLVIPSGQFAAVVGASGAGKSTLCALLPRFYEPSEGRILVDGKDIRDLTLSSLRRSIAWVQQDTYLFDASVMENIRMGREGASDEEVRRAALIADADGFIRELPEGYDSIVGERGILLSGGQRQRIGIARAILKNAPILLMDEATSSLDNLSEKRIYEALKKERKGKTTLVVCHRLSTIVDAQRILVMDQGKTAEDGTHEELMNKNGVYAALYKRQG